MTDVVEGGSAGYPGVDVEIQAVEGGKQPMGCLTDHGVNACVLLRRIIVMGEATYRLALAVSAGYSPRQCRTRHQSRLGLKLPLLYQTDIE